MRSCRFPRQHDGVLTEGQLAQFNRDGITVIRSAFSREAASRMQDVLWNELLHRYGVVRDDPSTWSRHEPTGLRSTKRSRAFAPICDNAVCEALDQLLGVRRWDPPRHFGNVLVTMPTDVPWRVPHRIWHSDFDPSFPINELFAVKLWALCDDVPPTWGGTPQLAGSHKLFARYLETSANRGYKAAKFGFLRSHTWLKSLTSDNGEPDRNERLLDVEVDVDGLPARVIEITGDAGDVFITHPWVFHSIATNAGSRPRFMRSVGIFRTAAP